MVPFFGEEYMANGSMLCVGIAFADLENDGEAELAAVFHHDKWLPSVVRTFDRDGNVLGTYQNWGYLEEILAGDFDGDGADEIIACGTNNHYDGATVVLLDAEHLSGYSVDDGFLRPGFADGSLARAVFPFPDPTLQVFFGEHSRLHAARLVFAESESPPTITVKAGVGLVSPWALRDEKARGVGSGDRGQPYVVVRLGIDLRPVEVIVPGGNRERLRELREAGAISIPADEQAFWDDWIGRSVYTGRANPKARALP